MISLTESPHFSLWSAQRSLRVRPTPFSQECPSRHRVDLPTSEAGYDGWRFETFSPSVLHEVKKLNAALFPIAYRDSVYRQALACGAVSQVAVDAAGAVAGAVLCRLEAVPRPDDPDAAPTRARQYVVTVGVLEAYRGRGLGSLLMRRALDAGRAAGVESVPEAFLHVQANADAARRFYARLGFRETGFLSGYYRRSMGVTGCLDARMLTCSFENNEGGCEGKEDAAETESH